MNTKLYLLLLTLTTCISTHGMDPTSSFAEATADRSLYELRRTGTPPTKLLMPEGLAFPVEDIWLNVIARSCCKWKLRETCKYFHHFASIANDKIFLQNPLVIKPELLKQYAIYFADSESDTAIISNLLDQGLNPNTEDAFAYVRQRNINRIHATKSLLYYAVENENITTVNLLLNHPLLITDQVVSPFNLALELNLVEIAKKLITPKTVNLLGQAYHYKATNHNIDVLKHILLLKENDSDVPDFLFTCLTHATRNNYVKLATFILDYAARINCALLEQGRLSASIDYPSMHKLLLKHGAHVDTISEKLRYAIQRGSINTVLFLINQGASLATRPGAKSLLCYVMYVYMVEEHNRIPLLQILLNKGIDVNEKSGMDHDTPLGVAINYPHTQAVKLLLAHPGIDVNIRTDNDKTPLDIAIEKRNSHLHCHYCRAQKSISIDSNYCGKCGKKILAGQYTIIIQLLIEHGAKRSSELHVVGLDMDKNEKMTCSTKETRHF